MARKYRPVLLRPDSPILGTSASVADFWSWAYSDLRSNTTRPLLAEYLVGKALDVLENPREEWASVDFTYRGVPIEVKSSGYLQSWGSEPSRIIFDIARKKTWDPDTSIYSDEAIRSAWIYVFCLHTEKNPERYNALNVAQWEFYVLRTSTLNRELGNQKSVGLRRLRGLVRPVRFGQLREAVGRELNE